MKRTFKSLMLTVAGVLFASGLAGAQINEVPMKGEGNDWVKELDLKGRIEYRVPQAPGPYQSVASRDKWDCKKKRQANVSIVYYTWHNLEDNDPDTAVSSLESWGGIEPESLGETLLEFACSLE